MDLRVDPASPIPPSRQLVEALLDRIASGRVGPGERLPSVRGLAATALVNPNTVLRAYRDLEALGVVEGRAGSGVFVAAAASRLACDARRDETLARLRDALDIALGSGHDPDDLEADLVARLVAARRERDAASDLAWRPSR